MTDASDPTHAIVRHERTSEPDMNQVRLGWKVRDRSGWHLGKVVERDDVSFVVAGGSHVGGGTTRVPIRLVADEDPHRRCATLVVSTHDLRRLTQSDPG